MTICRYSVIAILAGITTGASTAMAADAPSTDIGRKCFDRYVKLEAEFDPKAIQMYSDNALIEITFIQPDGTQKTQQVPADTFKADTIRALPEMKKKSDTDLYKNIQVTTEGDKYWITANDYSVLRKDEGTLSMRMDKNCVIDALEMVYKK